MVCTWVLYKCSDQRRQIPVGTTYWLLKNCVDASAISVVVPHTSFCRQSPPNQQEYLWEQKASPEGDTAFGLEGDAEAVALPGVL